MKRFVDLSSKVFGEWFVIRQCESRYWWCRCTCGREQRTYGPNLTSGKSKKCRHCCKNNILPEGQAALNLTFGGYQRSATRRGYTWSLSKEDFLTLTQKNCEYCGAAPNARYGACAEQRLNGVFIGNGIDRVENSEGYSLDNCVPCCKQCNYMKHEWSIDEFKAHILRIAAHMEAM